MVAEEGPDGVASAIRLLVEEVAALREQVTAIAKDTRALRDQADASTPSRSRTRRVSKPGREDRRRGFSAAMARLFWNRLMKHFAEAIRREGPMSAAQLRATLDADALEMAEAAFERIDVSLITEKVDERVKRGIFFKRTGDGCYDVL